MTARRALVALRACLAAGACAAGCQGYGLRVSFDTPDAVPAVAAPAPAAPSSAAAAGSDPAAAPDGAAQPGHPAPAADTLEPPRSDARERAAQLAAHYREWRSSSVFLARRLDAGLETPATVRDELMNLKAQILELAPHLGDPLRGQIQACAEEYGPLADRHSPGRSRDTAARLRILSRRIQRLLE